MKNHQHQLSHKQPTAGHPVQLAEVQLFEVSGGLRARLIESPPVIVPEPKEPVYITLAIGEGGGKLPDILS
ncbi:hypothetical protein [Alteromonas gracilis]|uniref:hypothetical protein n=1 Tax=Alteromonas gracilis TaxID=1479524 RepID=UPI002FE1D695